MKISAWLPNTSISCFRLTLEQCQTLETRLPGHTVAHCETEADFLAQLPETQVAIVWKFAQGWFARAPEMQWIVTPAAGKDYFRITPPPGVSIDNGGFHGVIMAETVLAMMLASCRGVLTCERARGTDPWPRKALDGRMHTLRGSHVGILGFGRIGQWVGRLAKPFGARITGIRRSPSERPDYFAEVDRVLPVDALDSVLPEFDHLVLVLPRSPETDRILDERRLGLLRETCYLYNVGRGNAIDEEALARALQDRRLAGACLDVFATEPLPEDSPLRSCPTALLMPHASAFDPSYLDRFLDEFAERFRARYR